MKRTYVLAGLPLLALLGCGGTKVDPYKMKNLPVYWQASQLTTDSPAAAPVTTGTPGRAEY